MRSNINKRDLLIGSLTGTASVMALAWGLSGKKSFANEGDFEITKTEEEWRAQLSEIQFQVLRKEDTERPFTSPLNDEKRIGLSTVPDAIFRFTIRKQNLIAVLAGLAFMKRLKMQWEPEKTIPSL